MKNSIAIFDSGIGGLTVLKSIMQLLPNERYIYLADSEFFPYGTKSFVCLKNRLQKVVRYLLSFDVKAIVIACNTASLYVDELQKLTDIPIVGVIAPTCKKVSATTINNQVCLLATDATIKFGKYQQILRGSGTHVIGVACSDFVPFAENGQFDAVECECVITNKLQRIKNLPFDTVVLGCTHFGLLKDLIIEVLGKRNYIECGEPTALALKKILSNNNLIANNTFSSVKMLSTGSFGNFEMTKRVLPVCKISFKVVQI